MNKNRHKPLPLENDFKTHLGLKGRAPRTIGLYCRTLSNLPLSPLTDLPNVEGKEREEAFRNARRELEELLANSNLRNRNNFMTAIRSFARFLHAENYINARELNYFIETFKYKSKGNGTGQKEKWAIPREEWNDVLRHGIHKVAKFALWLGLNFGLRRGEIIHLRVQDVDFKANELRIRAQNVDNNGQKNWEPKTRKGHREIPFSPDHAKVLQKWIKDRPELDHPYLLWVPFRGNNYLTQPDEGTIYYWCRKIGKSYGFKRTVHPHVLRYSFACHYYFVVGMPLKTLSDLLGHADIAVTSEYLELGKKESKEEARKYIS